jgi:hypothetical protein
VTREIKWKGEMVPIEAECSACADARFKVPYDRRQKFFHQPSRPTYLYQLERAFKVHLLEIHSMTIKTAKDSE